MYYPNSEQFYSRVHQIFDKIMDEFPNSRMPPFGGKKKGKDYQEGIHIDINSHNPKGGKRRRKGGAVDYSHNEYLPSDVHLQNVMHEKLREKALRKGPYHNRQIDYSDDITAPELKKITEPSPIRNYPFDESDQHLPMVRHGTGRSGGGDEIYGYGGNARASADVSYPYNNGATCGSGVTGGKKKKKLTRWMKHVKALKKANPGVPLGDIMKEASKSYNK